MNPKKGLEFLAVEEKKYDDISGTVDGQKCAEDNILSISLLFLVRPYNRGCAYITLSHLEVVGEALQAIYIVLTCLEPDISDSSHPLKIIETTRQYNSWKFIQIEVNAGK